MRTRRRSGDVIGRRQGPLLQSGHDLLANAAEDAYALLLQAACARYTGPMPYLFAEDVASLLLMSGGLLVQGSLLARVVDGLDAEACSPVEVLGWLYQFYVAERKDEVFAGYKKRKKAQAADIAPATQLFTPEWIVRYLAQNSAVASYALTILAPTLHFEVGQVAKLPILGPARPRKGAGPQRVEVAINFMSL